MAAAKESPTLCSALDTQTSGLETQLSLGF